MALEAVVFQQDLFSHSSKEVYNLFGGNWGGYVDVVDDDYYSGGGGGGGGEDHKFSSFFCNFPENQTENNNNNFFHGDNWNYNYSSSSPPGAAASSMVPHFNELHLSSHPSPEYGASVNANGVTTTTTTTTITTPPPPTDLQQQQDSAASTSRAKRRRSRSRKNKEEIENQRMTHIAVERNRRKQMNEYLSVLRSLMPDSYVQRGDQASIIGGAINFVKELEQRLQLLCSQKETNKDKSVDNKTNDVSNSSKVPPPFSEFFTFPQYSTTTTASPSSDQNSVAVPVLMSETMKNSNEQQTEADIEVTMVESHANLKIRSKRRPKLLLKLVSGLQTMRLTVLHLNVTTVDQFVLYSLSVKVEDDCRLSSVDEIATAVYQMLGRIQEESLC